jgi:mannose-6-phosphate isomerase-like protein (cupin superfamily)
METPWKEKYWGKTQQIWRGKNGASLHLILLAGGYCSFHFHRERANLFHVLTGRVRVVTAIGWKVEYADLMPVGDMASQCIVPSRVPHQFQVLEDAEMIEEYWPDRGGLYMADDIVRLTEGGFDLSKVNGGVGVIISPNRKTTLDLREEYTG